MSEKTIQDYLNSAPGRLLTCTKCQRYLTRNYSFATKNVQWLTFNYIRSKFIDVVSEQMPSRVILPIDRMPSEKDAEAFLARECTGRVALVVTYDSETQLQHKANYYFDQPNDALFFKMYFH